MFARDSGLTAGSQAAVAAARAAVAWLAGHTTGLGPPGPVQPSADGQAAQFTVNVTGSGSLDHHVVQGIRAAIAGPVRSAGSGLVAAVTGAAAIKANSSPAMPRMPCC